MTKTANWPRNPMYERAKTAVELRLRELNWRPSYGWPTDLRPFPVPPGYGEEFQAYCDVFASNWVRNEIAKRQNAIKTQAIEDAERMAKFESWYILADGEQPYVYGCETAGEVAFFMRCFLEKWDTLKMERIVGNKK